jgi:hypothetical protein
VILSCAWYGGYTGKKRGGSDSLEGVGEFWSLGRSEEGCGRGGGRKFFKPGKGVKVSVPCKGGFGAKDIFGDFEPRE